MGWGGVGSLPSVWGARGSDGSGGQGSFSAQEGACATASLGCGTAARLLLGPDYTSRGESFRKEFPGRMWTRQEHESLTAASLTLCRCSDATHRQLFPVQRSPLAPHVHPRRRHWVVPPAPCLWAQVSHRLPSQRWLQGLTLCN